MSPAPRRHRPPPASLWLACLLLALAVRAESAGAPALPASLARQPVVPGVEYWHWTESVPEGPLSLHAAVIEWPRREFRFEAPLAAGTITGLRTVAEQIRALPAAAGTPVVAVNGDFFVIQPDPYRGDPRGLQVWNGEVVSDAAGTATFWVDARGLPRMGVVESRFEVRFPGGRSVAVGLNERRPEDGAVLYTPRLGTPTRTTGGRELVLRPVAGGAGSPRLEGSLAAEVVRVHAGGDQTIPADGLVLSMGAKLAGTLPRVEAGDRIELAFATVPALGGVEVAVAGGPVLVSGGRAETWKSSQPRHPRTAVGWNARQLFLLVVDGRQAGHSVGMTFPELADLMVRLGCEEALNLDGGGSSTLWVDGRVVNRPSDGRERAVANSLILLRRP